MMTQEDYVSFETAKLLKEKGFNESTICRYAGEGGITEKWYDDYRERVLRFDWKEGYLIEPSIEQKDQYEIIGNTILAPTLQMARKWLRKIYGIDIIIDISDPSVKDRKYYCMIWDENNNSHILDLFNSYEEACEITINYCLKNII